MKFRYDSPLIGNGINGLMASAEPFNLRHDPLDLESPPIGIPAEYNDIDFNKGELVDEPFKYEGGIGPPAILSPLNDLKVRASVDIAPSQPPGFRTIPGKRTKNAKRSYEGWTNSISTLNPCRKWPNSKRMVRIFPYRFFR